MSQKEFEERPYQLELVDYVSKRNGIIYLPTGSGKTYVAILALKRFSNQLQEPIENGGKRAIFMCNTVELARQQAICIKKCTSLKIGFYVGERDVDSWHRSKWEEEIRQNQVLVGTAQIFLDIIIQNYLKISDLNLVIIDECHHGTGQHPMHEFMRLFQMENQELLPRVIGLTGVLIKGNDFKNVEKRLKELEITYRGNIITVGDVENVMLYSTKPREYFLKFTPTTHPFQIVEVIKSKIMNFFKTVDAFSIGKVLPKMTRNLGSVREPNKKNFIKNIFRDFIHQMEQFGLYTASVAIVSILIELDIKRRQAETIPLRNLYRIASSLCDNIRHILIQKLRDMIDDNNSSDEECNTADIIINFSTPKLNNLLSFMVQTFQGKNAKDICCLIFVERRHTAKCIYAVVQKFIDSTPELQNVVSPQFMIGRNNLSMDFEGILERKWNTSAIKQFREGSCNMIICSNVLEEGIDVQACNYVLVLDPIKSFNSYVQTKGRARSKDASFIIFVPDLEAPNVAQKIRQYVSTHEEIKKYLQNRVLERCDPFSDEIREHFDDKIKPYQLPSGAILLPSAALSLLHRYCQQLPGDTFGIVLPWFRLLTSEDKKERLPISQRHKEIVSITLPLTSALKDEIFSDPLPSPRTAKISAAFKACIRLYEIGELNENLLPKSVREHVANVADVHFEHWKKFDDDVTGKVKGAQERTYENKCPAELYDALPRVGEPCYAYVMTYKPKFEKNEYNEHLYEALLKQTTYALLLRHRLPRLAAMPLFMNQGQLNVQLAYEPIEVIINNAQDIKKIKMYHMMIFRDLLKTWRPYFVMDKRSLEYSYLIVPITEGQLDMNLISKFQRLSSSRSYTTVERAKQVLRAADYEGSIITQWYASYDEKRFVVTKVRTDLTPQSKMDNKPNGPTFGEFTLAKYGHNIRDIVHKDKFLIEVRELTPRSNFFINAKGKSITAKKQRSTVILIPELCFNFQYPANMWIKALFLPCILHRIKYMLHAEHLRCRINRYLDLDQHEFNSNGYYPKPLIIDESLRRNFDEIGDAIPETEFDEPKSSLDPLPTRKSEVSLQKLELTELTNPWQDYMEPLDHARDVMQTYPVELAYYHKFTSGKLSNVDALLTAHEELWTVRQFQVNNDIIYEDEELVVPTVKLPAIADVSLVKKRHLNILARSGSNADIIPAEQAEFVAALTTASASDVFDMERFELLGDSFLKLGATLYLANKYPMWNEGVLTEVKSKMVSNRNLLYCLYDTDIPSRICKNNFMPKYSWMPPCVCLPTNVLDLWQQQPDLAKHIGLQNLHDLELNEEQIVDDGVCSPQQFDEFISNCKQNAMSSFSSNKSGESDINCFINRKAIKDKIIADTLEALLGVCVKNYGLHNSFRMLEFFGILKSEIDKPLTNLLDLQLISVSLRTNISAREVDGFLLNYQHLESNLGYKFRDRAYLLQALTHPSYPTNRLTGCYQELEFIGDAILDFLISAHIFERNATMTPGQLTDLRSALVNNITLGCICVRRRFHLFILAENSTLSEAIKNFAEFQETQKHRVTDQVRILMEEQDAVVSSSVGTTNDEANTTRYNLSQNVDVPKALGDIVEAIIAAVYLDCRDLQRTWEVIYNLFEPELFAFSAKVPLNPIRKLNEHPYAKPKFSNGVIDKELVMVSCQFTCIDKSITVHGFGSNTKQAKLSAAKHALQKLAKHESN